MSMEASPVLLMAPALHGCTVHGGAAPDMWQGSLGHNPLQRMRAPIDLRTRQGHCWSIGLGAARDFLKPPTQAGRPCTTKL